MERNDVTVFQQSLMACGDPVEIARKVKLTFKKMPGEMALACFAKVMTADLPHPDQSCRVGCRPLFAHLVGR